MVDKEDQRRRDLAKIHIARKELQMDGDAYRILLQGIQPGATSSADLTPRSRGKVLHRLQALGWKPKTSRKPRQRITAQHPQDRMIRGIWLELADAGIVQDRSEHALQRFVKRQTGVDRLDWLDGKQAAQVIEALKGWKARTQEGGL